MFMMNKADFYFQITDWVQKKYFLIYIKWEKKPYYMGLQKQYKTRAET